MARAKSKIEVRRVVEIVNKLNRESKGELGKALREGANMLLGTILHECNAYRGYGYYSAKDVPAGELPGIVWGPDCKPPHTFPDDTRRYYYA